MMTPRLPALAALLCWFAPLLCGCVVQHDNPSLAGQDIHLTVIHTSDIHSRIFPYNMTPNLFDRQYGMDPSRGPFGGAARMATVINRERMRAARVIHLDSGDSFQGAPVFNLYRGEPEFRAQDAMGLDAAALGNHEFDDGTGNLVQQIRLWAGFPVLAANYAFDDPSDPHAFELGEVVQPYTILNVDGLKVGVIGMGNLESLVNIVEGGNNLGVTPLDTDMVMQFYSRLLRPQVDLLVVVSHLGLNEDEQTALASGLQGQSDPNNAVASNDVDVIFGGHLHIVLNPPKVIPSHAQSTDAQGVLHSYDRQVILCHSGAFAKFVGRLDLVVHINTPQEIQADLEAQAAAGIDPSHINVHRGRVVAYDYNIFPIDSTIPDDATLARILTPYQVQLNMSYDLTRVFAYAALSGTGTQKVISRRDPGGGDSQLGNMVADAMRLRPEVGADFSATNSLGIRTDMDPGPVTLEEMFNIFPFENTITVMYLSGKEVYEMLDFNAQKSAERGCSSQLQVSGIRFVIDCAHACQDENNPALGTHDPEDVRNSGDATIGCATHIRIQSTPTPGTNWKDDPNCTASGACWRELNPFGSYRVAVNDYMAAGGSGFIMLKRNTTKINTGISLRDALIDYLQNLDSPKYLAGGAQRCASFDGNPELAPLVNVPVPTAHLYCPQLIQYDKNGNPSSSQFIGADQCFGNIICLTPSDDAHDGRITTTYE